MEKRRNTAYYWVYMDGIRPQRELIENLQGRVMWYKEDLNHWPVWHYHPEQDILLNLKFTGRFMAGDYVGRLEPGTLLFNAPNVPHVFQAAEKAENDPDKLAMKVVFFSKESLGDSFLAKNEMAAISSFLNSMTCSVEVVGETRERATALIHEMSAMSEPERLAQLIRILHLFSQSDELQPLASFVLKGSDSERIMQRINDVLQFITEHPGEKMQLKDVADVVGMTEKTFSRFFKQNTGIPFVEYIHKLRVLDAQELLRDKDVSIAEVAYEVGFNNLAFFNRIFKRYALMTPKQYRQRMQEGVAQPFVYEEKASLED